MGRMKEEEKRIAEAQRLRQEEEVERQRLKTAERERAGALNTNT